MYPILRFVIFPTAITNRSCHKIVFSISGIDLPHFNFKRPQISFSPSVGTLVNRHTYIRHIHIIFIIVRAWGWTKLFEWGEVVIELLETASNFPKKTSLEPGAEGARSPDVRLCFSALWAWLGLGLAWPGLALDSAEWVNDDWTGAQKVTCH